MITEEQKIDLDLDVVNELNKLPDNNNCGYIYVSIMQRSKEEWDVFSCICGKENQLQASISYLLMKTEFPNYKCFIFDAVLNYLKDNKEDRDKFMKILKSFN